MTYSAGDLLLVHFPYTSGGQVAPRPALVILDTGDQDVLLARITTRSRPTAHDVPITDWHGGGLIAPSVVRLHKMVTLAKTRVLRQIGALQVADRAAVSTVLGQLYGNW